MLHIYGIIAHHMNPYSPEAGYTNIFCIRHTATDWPHGGLSYSDISLGLTFPPLSPDGIADAHATGATLRAQGIELHAAYVSPYLRTLETLHGILAGGGYRDMPIVINRNLGEVWAQGMLASGLDIYKLRWPGEIVSPENGEMCGDIYDAAVLERYGYEIESPSEMAWRVDAVFSLIHAYCCGLNVLVVSHGEPLAFGIHMREIAAGPMPTTFPLETAGRRYNKGEGMYLRLGPDGRPVAMHTLNFGPDGTEYSVGVPPYME